MLDGLWHALLLCPLTTLLSQVKAPAPARRSNSGPPKLGGGRPTQSGGQRKPSGGKGGRPKPGAKQGSQKRKVRLATEIVFRPVVNQWVVPTILCSGGGKKNFIDTRHLFVAADLSIVAHQLVVLDLRHTFLEWGGLRFVSRQIVPFWVIPNLTRVAILRAYPPCHFLSQNYLWNAGSTWEIVFWI